MMTGYVKGDRVMITDLVDYRPSGRTTYSGPATVMEVYGRSLVVSALGFDWWIPASLVSATVKRVEDRAE